MNTQDTPTTLNCTPSLARGTWLAAFWVACTYAASAHPGHGPGDVPISHWFTSPDHLALFIGCGLLCWVAASRVGQKALKNLLRGFGLALWIFSACMIAWTF